MSERATEGSEMEPGRASEPVVDVATQTEDRGATEQQERSLARAQSFERDTQLSKSRPYRETRVLRNHDTAVEAQHRSDGGGAPAVRLDMDLDVDVKMQARINGRLELSILQVFGPR
ncbi:hypothetical protein MYCTH_2303112 [Thermothelomyces thermophilus ATCC 42464]|uniref:Uncharacterized protein n=1 Tax=Thermothelomyces thermophilus (strain ATCC 42464 / BCRC 31852 / DSM 1799) TaxID=573729 RepID=G2QC00_THET4|nr:uncharacterized protein MYCTH_2303112 [Thermothelomyces thermophilus ATCC 42464]AEO57227.1 hypothetical protein MYCTH_2303112 [Thermothelomyces thermophilus ATCC 42464]